MQLYNAILHACIRVDLCFCRNRNRKLSMFASFCLCARALFTRLITASPLRPNVVIGCTSVRLLVCISASLSLSREHSNPTYFLPFLSACLPPCPSHSPSVPPHSTLTPNFSVLTLTTAWGVYTMSLCSGSWAPPASLTPASDVRKAVYSVGAKSGDIIQLVG